MIRALAVLLVLAAQQPARDTRPPVASAGGAVTGVVTSDEARPRPLRRVRVTLNGAATDVPRLAITADDGTFAFDRVPPGRYTVAAAKAGYVSMAYGATRPGRSGAGFQIADQQHVQVAMRLPRGAVITGTVVDVDGQPASGVGVSALTRRYSGSRISEFSYVNAGAPPTATTDDRGAYRIYGLAAGEYIVATQPVTPPGTPPGTVGTAVQRMARGTASTKRVLLSQVFHPGTSELSRAARVRIRAGEERAGIDVQLEYVPLATVSGTANLPVGFSPARVTLWRTDEQARFQTAPVTSADQTGRFRFSSVAPGQYRVAARAVPAGTPPSGRGATPAGDIQYAFGDIAVNGEDVEVTLATQAALTISGRIVFEGDQASVSMPQLRLNMPLFAAPANGGFVAPPIVVEGDRFRVEGVVPGPYWLGQDPQGVRSPVGRWWLKSITGGGRELLDAPLDFQQSIDDAVATFGDRASEISGRLLDAAGTPALELRVVVFTTDRRGWFFNSRRIAAVRPDREGRYAVRNLPPGEYRVAAVDLEPNEWFDPAVLEQLLTTATAVTIAGVERHAIDLVAR